MVYSWYLQVSNQADSLFGVQGGNLLHVLPATCKTYSNSTQLLTLNYCIVVLFE